MNASRVLLSPVLRNTAMYLDKKIIIIKKPPGIVSQTSVNSEQCSQEDALDGVLEDLKHQFGLPSRPLPVHRLDKSTTGALLLARTPQAARDLSQQFATRTVHKTYLALVRAGRRSFTADAGEINARLKIEDGRVEVSSRGKEARTAWELVGSSRDAPLSLLRLRLHTGLKHQLRVHLASVLKAPILGDVLYSQSDVSEKITGTFSIPKNRLFLHALHISFFRYRAWGPAKRFRLGITAPLPEDFTRLCVQAGLALDALEIHGGVTLDGHPAPHDLSSIEGHWLDPQSPDARKP